MNKGFFSKIFSNKIFLIILSFIISITIWISINVGDYAETSYVVSNIPITINLPQSAVDQDLKVFNSDELKGSVTVSGNRSIIGTLDGDDIQIIPEQTDSLTSVGSYTLSLMAKKKENSLNYTIESVSPATVYVKLDRNRTITSKIEQNINYTIPKDYYGTVILNENQVSISGPETEIKKIEKVVIKGKIDDELTSSVTNEYDVKLLDTFGEELTNTETLSINPSKVKATVSVLEKKEVPVNVSFSKAPVGIDLSNYYTIDPARVSLATESSNIKNISQVNTQTIDFSTLRNKDYNLIKDLNIPNKCIDINSVKSVNVKLNLSSMKKKTITLDTFNIEGLSSDYYGEVTTSSLAVTVYGLPRYLDGLSEDDIEAYADLTDVEVSDGSREVPLTIRLKGVNGCWIYGSYNVVVDIVKQ